MLYDEVKSVLRLGQGWALGVLSVGAVLGCSPASTGSKTLQAPSAKTDGVRPAVAPPPSPEAECRALAHAGLRIAREFLGDATVFRFGELTNDAELVALAPALGASAEPTLVVDLNVEGTRSDLHATLVGVAQPMRFARFVRAGSLVSLGQGDVAVPELLARALGVDVGSQVSLHLTPVGAWEGVARTEVRRIAALLAYPGDELFHYADQRLLTSLEAARELSAVEAHGEWPRRPGNPSAVAFWFADVEASPQQRVELALKALPSKESPLQYRVIPLTEWLPASLRGAAEQRCVEERYEKR